MELTPNTRMKYVGWATLIVTRRAVHDDPLFGAATALPPVTFVHELTPNVCVVGL